MLPRLGNYQEIDRRKELIIKQKRPWGCSFRGRIPKADPSDHYDQDA